MVQNSLQSGRELAVVGAIGGAPRELALCHKLEQKLELVRAHRGTRASSLCLRLPSGFVHHFGPEPAAFTIEVKDTEGLRALESLDELAVAEAYIREHLEFSGNPLEYFQYRDILSDAHWLSYVWINRLRPRLLGQAAQDIEFIGSHYDQPPEFFELWLDSELRSYSHGFFEHDDESLEAGMRRKLQYALDAVGAKPGDRVLDIGSGWGSFLQYAGERGIEVTSITISDESERYVKRLLEERGLAGCRVLKRHLLEFQDQPFDAIVNLGVSEHLPDYPKTIAQYCKLLKPGGKLYLDAYSGEKFGMSRFVMKWVFQSNTSPLCLTDYFRALAETDLEVISLQNDRHNYFLSCKKWAENLDRARATISERWGSVLYRRFHLYLWCSAYAFLDGMLDAHRLVLARPTQACGRHLRDARGLRRRLA